MTQTSPLDSLTAVERPPMGIMPKRENGLRAGGMCGMCEWGREVDARKWGVVEVCVECERFEQKKNVNLNIPRKGPNIGTNLFGGRGRI